MAKYLYALNESGELVKIQDAAKRESKFFCPYCRKEMIRKMGEKREWHYAHHIKIDKEDEDKHYNNYLHTLAEIKIMDWWNSGEEIKMNLQYNEICPCFKNCLSYNGNNNPFGLRQNNICKRNITRTINLNTIFGYCEREKSFSTKEGKLCRADLFCHNKEDENDPLFLEIDCTNKCKEEKIHSGIRIIEFVIKSEEDIDAIIGKTIAKGEKVHFYNVEEKEKRNNETDGQKAFCDKYEKQLRKRTATILTGVPIKRTPRKTSQTVNLALPPGVQQCCSICRYKNPLRGRKCSLSRDFHKNLDEKNDGKNCGSFKWDGSQK